jgi:antitoxin (DNA-binding transcriptional repressor) of toxin-antitoxin stability system
MVKKGKQSISIRELHEHTGELVRRASASRIAFEITDRGEVVAVLANPNALPPPKRPKRVLLPGYRKLILEGPLSDDVLEDLEAVRGER